MKLEVKYLVKTLLFCLPLSINAQLFTDASTNLPAAASGASMDVRAADLDGDGDRDIVLAREFQPNVVLRNEGNGIFVNATIGNLPQEVHDSEDVAIADFNGDGHPDLVFCSEDDVSQGWTNVHEFYLGDGTGHFTAAAYQPPDSEANAVITADIDADGLPDLVFGNDGIPNILINNGSGGFTLENDRVPPIARVTQDLLWLDVDNDGDGDLFLGNENGNLLYINVGAGQFADETAIRLPSGLNMETREVAAGDVDGDNDLDIFLANVEFIPGKDPQNRLFINNGNGHFTDGTAARLPVDSDHTIDAIFEDLDLDSDLDLVLGNVFGAHIKTYLNDGTGHFADSITAVLGQFYHRDALGVIAEDLNGDGLRDLYFCHRKGPQNSQKDLLLLRSPLSNVQEKRNNEAAVTIFPNPVRDYFCIKTTRKLADSIRLENAAGQTVRFLKPEKTGPDTYRCQVDRAKLAAGVYFIQTGGGRKKIVLH